MPLLDYSIPNTAEGQALKRRLLHDYPSFVKYCNGAYMSKFHNDLCTRVQQFMEAKTKNSFDILLVDVPPQFGKSFSITETLPAWVLAQDPSKNVIISSYMGTVAETFSRPCRDKFVNYAHKLNARAQPNKNVQGVGLWETTAGGRCRAAGLQGGITRFGADLFILDDPIKSRKEALSKIIVGDILAEMGPVVSTRIRPGGKLIIILTRWIKNDPIGYCKERVADNVWAHLHYPALCDNEETDLLGRKLGQALMGEHLGDRLEECPEAIRHDQQWTENQKRVVVAMSGQAEWDSLYQGSPTQAGGALFKEEHFKGTEATWKNTSYKVLSVDATFTGEETSDFVAMGIYGIFTNSAIGGGSIGKFGQTNNRMTFVETITKIRALNRIYKFDVLYIENKANGPAIVSMLNLERQNGGDIPSIIPIDPKGGKYARAQAAASYMELYGLYLSKDFYCDIQNPESGMLVFDATEGKKTYKQQMLDFPAGHDDMVDETSQAILKLAPIATGEEVPVIRETYRYVKWYPDMWEDYYKLDAITQKEFIRIYGAPLEWRPVGENT